MSALSFKINAETDKLNSFIASLKRLKEVLADIPSGTKEFDVINRKIAEMEARVEQTMKRIAQMQNEAAKTVSQPTAPSPAAPSSVGSASGAQAVNAETEAWYDLLEELGLVAEAQEGNIRRLKILESENVKLKKAIENINKAEQDGIRLSERQHVLRTKYTLDLQRNKVAISEHRSELANQIKFERAAIGSMDGMSQSLARMRTVYRSLGEGERGSAFGQNLLKNIQTLDTKIKELDASIGNHQRNVGNYASSWNGLSFSIQQVARELPSLAVSPQTFFLAISNNLPILADQLALTKQRVQELKNAGQSFTPVWKQVLSSIISWQTALVAGITVLTLYGKEIAEWIGSLFKGKQGIDSLAEAQKELNSVIEQEGFGIGDQIIQIKELQRAWNKLGNDLSSKHQFIEDNKEKFNDLGISVNNVSEAENILIRNTSAFIESLKLRAEAAAAQKLAAEAYEKALIKEQKAQEKIKKGYNAAETTIVNGRIVSVGKTTSRKYNEDEKKMILAEAKAAKAAADAWFDLKEAKELAADQKLNEAGIIQYQKGNDKIESQQEKTLNDLEKALQKLRDDALQAEIDSMQEGTAKKVAQINLDYQRRAEAINNAEQQIIKLQGELTREQADQLAAVRNANESQRNKEFGEATLPHIDIDNLFASERQSWNEYMIQYGNFRERLQATKDEYDRKIAEAGTEGERKVLEAEKQRTLAELEVEGSTWAQELSSLTVKALEELISETQKKLEAARKAYDDLSVSDSEEGTKLRGEIVKLDAELKKLKSVSKDAGKSVNDGNWSNAATAFEAIASGARSAVENIRDFDEGLAEALNTLINVSTNAAQFANSVDKIGEQGASFGNIMGSVSAGIGLISSIVGLFGQGETSMERNLRLAKEFNEELRIMNERARINSDAFSTIFGTNEWGNYLSNLEAMNDALDKYNGTLEEVKNRGKRINTYNQREMKG